MKTPSCGRFLTLLAALVIAAPASVSAMNWMPSGQGLVTNAWQVACSADGVKIVVAVPGSPTPTPGPILVSTNSGLTWTQAQAPITNWTAVASSANGNIMVASALYSGQEPVRSEVFVSIDSGTSWNSAFTTSNNVSIVAASADGSKLLFVSYAPDFYDGMSVYTSTNLGGNWLNAGTVSNQNWQTVTCSADCSELVAANGFIIYGLNEPLLISHDSGATWTTTDTPSNYWSDVAVSADGTKIVGVGSVYQDGEDPAIYISHDSGATWTSNNVPGLANPAIRFIASSADGSDCFGLLAAYEAVALSTDSGATWTWTTNGVPAPLALLHNCSADGNILFGSFIGSGQYNQLYISQTVPSPRLSILPTSDNLVLSWLVPSMSFQLQQSPDLNSAGWTDVTNAPTLNFTNLENQVTLPLPESTDFFRLKML